MRMNNSLHHNYKAIATYLLKEQASLPWRRMFTVTWRYMTRVNRR